MLHHLQDFVIGFVSHYGYAGLFIAMVFGNVGAQVGSEIIMPVTGGLVATGHLSSLWAAILVAVSGELVGGSLGYAVGRYGGRPFILRFGRFFHAEHLDRADAFFARWGTFAIFIGRFVPVIRGVIAIPAGISRMPLVPFYLWTMCGSIIFCGGLALLGHALGRNLDRVLPLLHKGGMIVLIVAVIVAIAIVFFLTRNAQRQRT